MNEVEFNQIASGLDARVKELAGFVGPFSARAAEVTNDPEGRRTVATVLTKAMLTYFAHAFDDETSRAAIIDAVEQFVFQMRAASHSGRAVN